MPRLSSTGHLGLAWETVYGTAVTPTVYVPYNTLKSEDTIKKVVDQNRRGVMSADFAVYNTTKEAAVDIDTDVYSDTFGYFLKSILSTYSKTGTTTITHKFQVANALPPTITFQDYDALSERQYTGAFCTELSVKFDMETAMTMSAKYMTQASLVTTGTTATTTTAKPFMGFQLIGKLGGVQNMNIIGGEVHFKRDGGKNVFTANNTTNPSKFVVGRISADIKLQFIVEDETELNYYLNAVQQTLDLKFTQADGTTAIDFSFGNVDASKATVDRSGEFIRVDLEFKALYNTTDNGIATVTLTNGVATY